VVFAATQSIAVGLRWGQSSQKDFAQAGAMGYMSDVILVENRLGVSLVWA